MYDTPDSGRRRGRGAESRPRSAAATSTTLGNRRRHALASRLLCTLAVNHPPTALRVSISVLLSGCVLADPDDAVPGGDDGSLSASASASASESGVDDPASTDDRGETDDGSDTGSIDTSATESGTDGGSDALPSAVAIAIATGRLHSCALTSAGDVRCWGYADYGQLGNGAPLDDVAFPIPVEVTGLDAGVTAISSHFDHTCAITRAGDALCWGANGNGQLGDGSTSHSAVPVAVTGLAGIVQIDAGVDHTCAITDGGAAHCWGKNDYGQLGDGSTTDSATPVAVMGLAADVVAIAAGRYHSCAVTGAGAVQCWGGDTYGELGDGDPLAASPTPVAVVGLDSGVVDVAASDSITCVITTAGAARCWGKNGDGQLGNGESGTLVESHVPTDVVGLDTGVTAISPGYGYACAVATGSVLCWGDNLDGALGNGEGPGFETPVPVGVVGLGEGGAEVGACSGHTCALTTDGAVRCWGNNGGGELGDGTDVSSNVPVDVVSLP